MTSRRAFLAAAAATSAAGAALSQPQPAPGRETYDFTAIAARLSRSARHRQVFAIARVADGAPLGQMWHALDAYERALGEPPGATHLAAVFYGRGVILGLDDSAWRTYGLANAARHRGELLQSTVEGNPFTSELAALTSRGVSCFVCDNALDDWANYLILVQGGGSSAEQVRDDLRTRLIPQALLVPAGVVALNQAQEAHFTYVQSSL